MRTRLCSCLALALLCSAVVGAQDDSTFAKTEAMIPARDGVKLHTVIFAPRDAPEPLPILLERTPYGAMADEKALRTRYAHLIADGYIFAFQDIRGRFKSEGQFVMQRQVRDKRDPKAIDESTDSYDTIQWLLDNVKGQNGRAGILGISYGGWLATMALLDPHPTLKAASEQASPADMFLGDDFHHNGAFRLSYGFEYAALLETSKEANTNFAFDRADTYQWYLGLGPLPNADEKYFHSKIPTWNDFVNHPNYDQFWRMQAFAPYIATPQVPNLNVAGWWDQEDFYGPVKIFELFEKNDPHRLNYLVAGPWNHGGWAHRDGSKLGEISFDSNTSKYFRTHIEAPWFAYWMKDMIACDAEIEKLLVAFAPRVDPAERPLPPSRKRERKGRKERTTNPRTGFDLRAESYKLFGVDLTQIPGLLVMVLTLFSEVGRDMSRWPTAAHFVSWLGLCPDNDISGGRVLWKGVRHVKNRAGQLFRLAAHSLHHEESELGDYLRRMKAKLDPEAATTATAHKIAVIFYTMVKKQVEYDATLWSQRNTERERRFEAKLRRQAERRGYRLVPMHENPAA